MNQRKMTWIAMKEKKLKLFEKKIQLLKEQKKEAMKEMKEFREAGDKSSEELARKTYLGATEAINKLIKNDISTMVDSD